MGKLLAGFILGVIVATIGISGVVNIFDKGVTYLETFAKVAASPPVNNNSLDDKN